jgi:tetratricopeptide (TPR) repeat protein
MAAVAGHEIDPNDLPETEAERRRIAGELSTKSRAALSRGELLSASLFATDALLLFPNDRAQLELFDEIVTSTQDPLSLFPVASGAVHVATAAGRARALMMQRRVPEAVDLLGRVFEVAPELEYLDWIRRWLVANSMLAKELGWERLMDAVVRPTLTMTIGAPVPTPADDERLPNIRAAAEIFTILLATYPTEKLLYYGASLLRRRLGDTAATLAAADEGVRRFPDDWGMRTALLNALRDARRPDEALQQARRALELDKEDFSPLHDAAWGFLDANRPGDAANLFQELLQREPTYPGAQICLHAARFRAAGGVDDRRALLAARDREPWDDTAARFADEIDPPVPYVTVLGGPADASARYGRMIAEELGEVMRCCGQGARIGVTIQSRYPESPSVPFAFDVALRGIGAGGAQMAIEIDKVQAPDPRADKGQVAFPVFAFQGATALRPIYAQGDPRAQQEVGRLAYQLFRRDVWDPAAKQVGMAAGPQAVHAFLSVMTNPPPPPPEYDGLTWTYRCQMACAVILSHLAPWESGTPRSVLLSLVSGPSDWVTVAGIVAFAWRAGDSPVVRQEVEGVFGWLRGLVAGEGFTPWEHALVHSWLALGGHPDAQRADLEAWAMRYDDTIRSKNVVRPLRRYGGLTLEEYARFCVERDRVYGGGAYNGPMGAMQAAFSPSQALVALCQRANVSPQYPYVSEWQEALNASPDLMSEFIEEKQRYEFEKMGVSGDEKAALDEIREGNMDMHLRMAQAQQAQAELNSGANADPDPLVFPNQRVARLSDYVRILKGMQTGNMMGALAQYGLDMMSYGSVAQAWAAKMAADPVLTEKFSRMMA